MPSARATRQSDEPGAVHAIPATVVFSNVPGNLQKPNLPLGMGVKFSGIDAVAAQRVAKYIAERTRAYTL